MNEWIFCYYFKHELKNTQKLPYYQYYRISSDSINIAVLFLFSKGFLTKSTFIQVKIEFPDVTLEKPSST